MFLPSYGLSSQLLGPAWAQCWALCPSTLGPAGLQKTGVVVLCHISSSGISQHLHPTTSLHTCQNQYPSIAGVYLGPHCPRESLGSLQEGPEVEQEMVPHRTWEEPAHVVGGSSGEHREGRMWENRGGEVPLTFSSWPGGECWWLSLSSVTRAGIPQPWWEVDMLPIQPYPLWELWLLSPESSGVCCLRSHPLITSLISAPKPGPQPKPFEK